MSIEDEYTRGYREGWNDATTRTAKLETRIGVLELALRTAARRFSFMASVGWINGVDPAVGYNECVAALQPEDDK